MLRSAVFARRLVTSSLPTRAIAATCTTIPPISYTPPHKPQQTPTRSSSSSRKLASILQSELSEEISSGSGSSTLPPELSTTHSDISKHWTIVEGISGIGPEGTGSAATVRLIKKENGSNGSKIGIVFHCQDTEEDNPVDDAYFEKMDEEEEEEEPAETAVRFAVTVSKGGKTVAILCRAVEGQLNIENVTVRDGDAEGVLVALAAGEALHSSLYQGPEFSELAEELQEAFHDYVEKECGVDEDLMNFMIMYADYREQEEYVAWMKTASSVLA